LSDGSKFIKPGAGTVPVTDFMNRDASIVPATHSMNPEPNVDPVRHFIKYSADIVPVARFFKPGAGTVPRTSSIEPAAGTVPATFRILRGRALNLRGPPWSSASSVVKFLLCRNRNRPAPVRATTTRDANTASPKPSRGAIIPPAPQP
jgi:hypothetical protein